MRRRALLGAAAAATTGAAGCGFELRRAPSLRFRSFGPGSLLGAELRRQIETSTTTQVVEAVSQAEVVFQALRDEQGRSVVASTTAGQVREIQLRSRLVFQLQTPSGRELVPRTELLLTRDLSYDETAALAKEQEQAELYRAMHGDIAAQVVRRLAAVPAI
jgi:LPS-assembly lipoprotein